MIIGRLTDVTRGYGAETVLENVDLEISSRKRVGVVGRNGSGKTTLMRVIAGELEPDAGEVWIRPNCRVAMMRQIPDFDDSETVESVARSAFADLEALREKADHLRERVAGGEAESESEEEAALLHEIGELDETFRRRGGFEIDFRVRSVLTGVGFSSEEFAKSVSVLSGGEKSRLSLAKLLLSAPELLLLDEPTNHLDLAAVEWLENYLRSWENGLLIISHDRFLLDRVTEETIIVTGHRVKQFPMPFTAALARQEAENLQQRKRYELQQAEIKRQETFIERNIVGQKTKQAQSRRRMLEKLERIERPEEDRSSTAITLEPKIPGGVEVLTVDGLGADIGGRTLFDGIELHVRRGDRIGVIGPNGSGKTTLMNALSGRAPVQRGNRAEGVGIRVGFLDQELTSLDERHGVLEEIQTLRPLASQTELRGYLARFLFRGDDVFKPVKALSGGERCRLAMAKLFLEGPNLIFLDEPTNHLDIDGQAALEEALSDYPGTVVAVSHDRAFLNNFAKTILHVHDGTAELFVGNFDDFKTRAEEAARLVATDGTGNSGAERYEARKQEKREREKRRRDQKRRKTRITTLESEVAAIEEELEALVNEMATPDLAPERLRELTDAHRETDQRRADLYSEWERLVEEAEAHGEEE